MNEADREVLEAFAEHAEDLEAARVALRRLLDDYDDQVTEIDDLKREVADLVCDKKDLEGQIDALEQDSCGAARNLASDLADHLKTCLYCEAEKRFDAGGHRCTTAHEMEQGLEVELAK